MNNLSSPKLNSSSSATEDLLVVDDDGRLLRIIAIYCAERRFTVSCASDAVEAIDLLNERHFDAVLTDFQMPGMSGLELAQWIRKNKPAVRICLMSSDTFTQEVRAVIASSIDRWLAKPFSMRALDECLSAVVSNGSRLPE